MRRPNSGRAWILLTTFRANALGTLNVLQVARELTPDAVIVVAGSSAEYGSLTPEAVPVREDAALLAVSPYGISKVAADLLAGLFARAYGLHTVCARPFFVTGPGKTGEIVWHFNRAGSFEFACLIAGHYEAGMHLPITVES